MEPKLNEIIFIGGKKYKCVSPCSQCAFHNELTNPCDNVKCSADERKDGRDIIFEEVF